MSYAIIRNTNYKIKNLNGIYRHIERKNTYYSNKNINKKNGIKNYSLKAPKTTYEKLFNTIRKQYDLKGQIKKVSNVACEYIITSDKEYFDKIGVDKTKKFFQTAYSFVCNYKELGEQYILSAKVHMDEKTPHMHIVFIPVIHTKDKKGNAIDKIACSSFWKGKDSYKYLQDNFHKYMQKAGFDLERGKNKGNEHLSIEQLKSLSNYEKIKEEIEKTPVKETNSTSLVLIVTENKKLVKHCNKLREYVISSANVFDKCTEYEKEINKLKKENSKLKDKIKNLLAKFNEFVNLISCKFSIPFKEIISLINNMFKTKE